MKSLLIYYSHYGNTAILANKFQMALGSRSKVDVSELHYSRGNMGLFERTLFRVFPNFVNLEGAVLDLSNYDVICLGVPVWGGRPSAPIARYLSLCSNLENKAVIVFYVFGLEASVQSCSKYVRKILEKKGAFNIIDAYFPWQNVHEEKKLDELIEQALDRVFPKNPPQNPPLQ